MRALLLVETSSTQRMLEEFLESRGFVVTVSTDPEEARTLALRDEHALVLVDPLTAGPHLATFCRALRQSPVSYRTEIVALVRAGDDEPQQLADLRSARVAAGVGTTSADALQRSLPEATAALENKAQRTSQERLLEREVDAVLMDRPAAEALVRTTGGQLRVLPEALAQEHYALVVAPQQAELLAQIDAALLVLERKGELGELDRRFELRAADSRER